MSFGFGGLAVHTHCREHTHTQKIQYKLVSATSTLGANLYQLAMNKSLSATLGAVDVIRNKSHDTRMEESLETPSPSLASGHQSFNS